MRAAGCTTPTHNTSSMTVVYALMIMYLLITFQ